MVFEKPKLPLELTGLEVVFLTDSISNKDLAEGLPDKDAYWPVARETLLLLGSAYVELVSVDGIDSGPVTLQITEEMAWLLRGKVKTGDMAIDKTPIGVALLTKLYTMIQEFNSELGDSDWRLAEEPIQEDVIVRLHEFREKEIANATANNDPDPDLNPNDLT